jgi:hypothetical protein
MPESQPLQIYHRYILKDEKSLFGSTVQIRPIVVSDAKIIFILASVQTYI